ncbi:hypothetical protein EYC84_011436 [Monilinia fructicola]|uniref:Uncharacterized protein n=1 Tax=Monilinia fructicola TaxID=38448 RepID=A0A5M9J7L7_MONFR|nr:hypothetical protein EYC84_011436 [Monilinia fructicola]
MEGSRPPASREIRTHGIRNCCVGLGAPAMPWGDLDGGAGADGARHRYHAGNCPLAVDLLSAIGGGGFPGRRVSHGRLDMDRSLCFVVEW